MYKTSLLAALLAATVFWPVSASAEQKVLNLCTGRDGGPYNQIGSQIASKMSGPNLRVDVIATNGTWDNIERTTGVSGAQPTQADYDSGAACHAFIGQPDGASLLARKNAAEAKKLVTVGELHTEYLHVLCNKESGYDDLDQLSGRTDVTVAIGPSGSGSWLIWDNFIYEDSSYKDVPTSDLGGVEAVAAVANGDVTCMIVPAGVPNATVQEADELFGDQLALAGATDKDFNDAKGIDGKLLYTYNEIPSGTYDKNLQGWFSASKTITWKAKVYLNTTRVSDQNVKAKFITAVARTRPWAAATFGGGN